MSVIIRSGNWHYRFNYNGKICSGRCTGCSTERQALAYEKQMRKKAEEIHGSKNVKALLENYREELVGGKKIKLTEALKYATSKPEAKQCTDKYAALKENVWGWFIDFMQKQYPDTTHLHQVTKLHIEDFLRSQKSKGIMASSVRQYKIFLSFVFNICGEEAGVMRNPCSGINIQRESNVPQREIFTEDELHRIMERAAIEPVIGNLFIVAGSTGLSCIDICLMRWSDINFTTRAIVTTRIKTGASLNIPINDTLMQIFGKQYQTSNGNEFVFPELYHLYNTHQIVAKVKAYLNACDIQTTITMPNGRVKNIKGIHSMRHVFCYYAGKSGIPLNVVQSIVGHMSPDMTKHYMAHSTFADKQNAMALMPSMLSCNTVADNNGISIDEVISLVRTAPQDKLLRIMAILKE